MRIIRNEEIEARNAKMSEQDRRNDPVKYALIALEFYKDELINTLVKSAREIFVEKAIYKAVADIKTTTSIHLVGCAEAEQLIAQWFEAYDQSVQATAKIGPDCSGNWSYAAEVVVTYSPRP